jgi:hypothetical protein
MVEKIGIRAWGLGIRVYVLGFKVERVEFRDGS